MQTAAPRRSQQEDDSMSDIRIGIIGTGLISNRHMRVWGKIPGVQIVAACDVHEKRLAEWGQRYGVAPENLYRNYKDLLARDDIDAVDVCVHNNLHMPLSIAVMRAGKHCYCEKPMAGSYADGKRMYDAQAVYGKKLAIQISSIMNSQTRIAKKMVEGGELGDIYHIRSVGERRLGRPAVDMRGAFQPEFYSAEYAGHGALFDIGVYHLSQLLYVAGLPELESVYGAAYTAVDIDPRLLQGRKFEVEDLGVGMARYKGGITMDILESWAINMDEIGKTFIAGSKGGLKFEGVDAYGGKLALDPTGPFQPKMPQLYYYGTDRYGNMVDVDLKVQENERHEENRDAGIRIYNDNQLHWLAYLKGELTDETRYNTPYIALQALLVSEGIFLSQKLGRSVTKDEIEAMSVSTAIQRQTTDWGVLEYDF